MPLLSINTLIFQGHDIRTALRELAQLGVARVELAFIKAYAPDLTDDFFTEERGRQFRDLLDEFGLTGPAVSAHMDLGADDAVEAFRRRMVFAQALGRALHHFQCLQSPAGDALLSQHGAVGRLCPIHGDHHLSGEPR